MEPARKVELVLLALTGLAILLLFMTAAAALVTYIFKVLDRKVGGSVGSMERFHAAVANVEPHIIDAVTRYPNTLLAGQASHRQLAIWFRFLPSPANDEQREVLRIIMDRFSSYGGFNSDLSKEIGWDLSELIKRQVDSHETKERHTRRHEEAGPCHQ